MINKYQSKTTCLPSGKNQSQCVMNSSIMLLMVPLVTMFGLLNDNLRFNGLQNYCTFIRISVCVIYHNYRYITNSTIMYFKVTLHIVYQYHEFMTSIIHTVAWRPTHYLLLTREDLVQLQWLCCWGSSYSHQIFQLT